MIFSMYFYVLENTICDTDVHKLIFKKGKFYLNSSETVGVRVSKAFTVHKGNGFLFNLLPSLLVQKDIFIVT